MTNSSTLVLSEDRLIEIEARLETYDGVTLLETAETLLDEVQRMKKVDRHLAFLRETIEAVIKLVDENSSQATIPSIYGILSRARLAVVTGS